MTGGRVGEGLHGPPGESVAREHRKGAPAPEVLSARARGGRELRRDVPVERLLLSPLVGAVERLLLSRLVGPVECFMLRRPIGPSLLAATLLLVLAWSACGGGGGGGGGRPGTPPGTYQLTVGGISTSGSASLQHQVALTLKVN